MYVFIILVLLIDFFIYKWFICDFFFYFYFIVIILKVKIKLNSNVLCDYMFFWIFGGFICILYIIVILIYIYLVFLKDGCFIRYD